ncbi:Pentatricopeptide repeat-containing protein [Thalictrum thalictroides]|uniref:Pentatricopeptide repeat-containing protein n=1 Tax=Thalictrum thalictroides TaxID=46969 RepID=A0A7J6VX80_THATH|nr:Pentatricopeptide repeat-containing protein [Thalictrum thalictroides]
MPERNLITWSSMISMYTQHNCGHEALVLFMRFHKSSIENPNEYILASVLRACVRLRAVEQAIQVHCFVIKAGFEQELYVGTSLMDFYSKNGDIEQARRIFDVLPVKTTHTWTTIIAGYSQSGKCDVSLELFNQMSKTEVVPDGYVLSSVVSACSVLQFLQGGKQIHAYVFRNAIDTDVSVINVLIDLYSKCRRVKIGRKLFDQMPTKNVVSWTTMIAGYMQNSADWEAMKLFYGMTHQGWSPDGYTCTSILNSCGSLQALEQGRQVHAYTIKGNLESDDFVKNGLVDMYAKCSSLAEAKGAFDCMSEHNVISYNAMIEGYTSQGMLSEALHLFQEMRHRLCCPSLLTFVSLLGASALLSTIDLSRQIHGLLVKFGVAVDLYAGSSLVDVYSKCSCIEDARLVFEDMDEKDIVVWNAMIFGYTLNGQGEEALTLFLKLQLSRVKVDEFTFVALLTAASDLASLVHGKQFHNQLIKIGLELEPYISNALMDLYAKCGSIEEAQKMFDATDRRDVVCWNSMISRYAQHGQAEEALRMYERMRAEGIVPNYITFVGVLSACSHVGLVEIGLNFFASMIPEFGVEPGMEHYVSVVALLSRAGRLYEAKEFIDQMPIEPEAIVWRSLLSACRIAGDVHLGRYAAEMAISLNPQDSGSYVLLSNILASKGLWAEVENVRKRMDCNEALKEPGHSWIEVNKAVHVFIAKDKSHNQAESIYSVLNKLTQQIQVVGHMSDMNTFLEFG